jgi:hypothetical protein
MPLLIHAALSGFTGSATLSKTDFRCPAARPLPRRTAMMGTGSASTVTGGLAVSELNMETPGEDAAEQARPLAAEDDEADDEEVAEVPLEVDEADAAEQTRDAGYDDEDYR